MKQCSIISFFYYIAGLFGDSSKKIRRISEFPINNVFLERQSLRAMSGDSIGNQQLKTLFEAARWAPSEYNCQPWRFIYAHRNTEDWGRLFNLLVPLNQQWACNAAVLVVIISQNSFEMQGHKLDGQPSETHSFVTGASWMSLALQATMQGMIALGVAGFDHKQARVDLNIPDDYTIEMMCAIGIPSKKKKLKSEGVKQKQPSQRKPLKEIIAEGRFTF